MAAVKGFLVVLMACCAAPAAMAHVDAVVTLRPDGSMPELPQQYANARLHIGWPVLEKGIRFSLNGVQVDVPRCALTAIKARSMRDVELAGSWYHEAGMPHYLSVTFNSPGQRRKALKAMMGPSILFNLQQPSIIHASGCETSAAARR